MMVEEKECPTFVEIPKKVKELAERLCVYDIITKIWES